jgi:hypothetical protein
VLADLGPVAEDREGQARRRRGPCGGRQQERGGGEKGAAGQHQGHRCVLNGASGADLIDIHGDLMT